MNKGHRPRSVSLPRIAVVHPELRPGGGSEAAALWVVEALKNDYDVYLISMGHIPLEILNECYGTNIKPEEVKTIEIPLPRFFKNHFFALRTFRLARFCKKIAPSFDLMISAYNVMDFGKRGIQLICDFSFDDELRRTFVHLPCGYKRVFYQPSPLRWVYLKMSQILSGASEAGWKRNLTIANSYWCSQVMKQKYGLESTVIYPPVVCGFPSVPWEEKENGFIFLGRLAPEKRIEKIMAILKKVRDKGHDIHLHIVGRLDERLYLKRINEVWKRNKDWIFIEGAIFGAKKQELIARHRFGISGRDYEPFGIALAEMVSAGNIVFVPGSGGQVEIVKHSLLTYKDEDDGVDKIEKVLKAPSLQGVLLNHLQKKIENFSAEEFKKEIRKVVACFRQVP